MDKKFEKHKTQPPPAEAGGFFGRLKSAKEPGNSNPEAIVKLKPRV
jgi:hypothetical protein